MQYFYTNLSIFDKINTDDMDLQDDVYRKFSDRVDELIESIEPDVFGIDRFNYAGMEEEDMRLVIGFEDGKNAEKLVRKFEAFFIPKLNDIVSALAEEYRVTIDETNFEFEKDEEGFFEDDDEYMEESKKVKKCYKDKELNEAELSAVKNSIATLAKKYIAGSFFDKLVATTGISQAKDILLGDLKNIVGSGTSAPAAAKFAQAIKFAKSTAAVDTILANYMLAGDGMRSGIGYNESAQTIDHIEAFRRYLAESRKADLEEKCKGCCDKKKDNDKKKPSEKEIAEAIKIIESTGQKVIRPAKNQYVKNGCCGGKKIQKKQIKESAGYRIIDFFCNDICDPVGFKTLIDNAIATGNVDRESADAINDIELDGDHVIVYCDRSVYPEDLIADLRDGISTFMDTAVGIEAEVGEDVVDRWEQVFDNID